MEAPKKIWVWDYAAHQMVNDNPDSSDVSYIRADLVNGLVEALKLLVSYGNVYSHKAGQESPYEIARAALKALEEE